MKKTALQIAALAIICSLFAVGCEKEHTPQSQVDPNSYNATKPFMGCKWVRRTVNEYDDKDSETSTLTETIIFTSDSTALYYSDRRYPHHSDDEQFTDTLKYSIMSQGDYGYTAIWFDANNPREKRGHFEYDVVADVLVWMHTMYAAYCYVFTRE